MTLGVINVEHIAKVLSKHCCLFGFCIELIGDHIFPDYCMMAICAEQSRHISLNVITVGGFGIKQSVAAHRNTLT